MIHSNPDIKPHFSLASPFHQKPKMAAAETPAAKVTPFQSRVYALLSQIPPGRVTTYAALSKALNSSPRAVGGALRSNPFAPRVPCHRCIASTGVSFPSTSPPGDADRVGV